ncbi:MAG: hypothetical protein QXZ70_02760 [Candidatus Bathyarchaeia archaeon]
MIKLGRMRIIKIMIIGLIIGLAFYPWPSSESYGKFSGFDPANLYIKPNSNFDVQLDSNQINVKSAAPSFQVIHLALSDLPYKASFKVTVRNQSPYSYPVRITVSYPLNPNKIDLLFSSIDRFIYLEVYNSTGRLIRNEQLTQYSLDQPVAVVTEISTVQSSNEFISISVNNQTTSVTVSFQSEVYSLLRDQARLLSVEVTGANVLSPGYFSLEGDQIWNVKNFGEGQGNSTLMQSNDLFSIVKGNYSQTYVEHVFSPPANWSLFDALGITINGSGTHEFLRLWLNTDWDNRAFYYIRDDFVGSKRIFVSLLNPDDKVGSPKLDSIERIGIDFPKTTGTWGLGNVNIGKIETSKGGTEVNISDFCIDIKPHSLAYAPLTPAYLPISILLIAMLGIVLMLYFSDLMMVIKTLCNRLKLLKLSTVFLFITTFLGIFGLYFILFSLGDHAFDMFSQKVWSYDIAKYGLLSLYQRPAITSAASMFDGLGTQHAIFPYAPLAGLYYSVIGQTYFWISSNPSVYDPFFTLVVKSFQTVTTLGCGLIVFKLMRRYNCSWRTSFLTMIVFLLNPLILYDAAVWGHQDSFLIFFLLLSLWAYESDHPKIAYSALVLAVMVKSTAFAPAVLLVFVLIRKFGFFKLIDGALTGFASGMAVIMPYVVSGASPAMLINSTIFRVLQFGTLTFQYPRSAAVSADGYNIWPLVTYFAGARSRDRMWYPDYIKDPFFGISFLLAGQIIFVLISLVLLYLATKKRAKLPGSAALLLGVLMIASTMFLTKTGSRYFVFGIAYLIVSAKIINPKIKWLVIGIITFTSVFAMHGLLVGYTGALLHMYPAMSPTISINGVILSLYLSDIVITEMIIRNLFAFILLLVATIKALRLE